MKCEKCGTEMNYFQRGSSCGYECPECEWGVATTYIDPINEDITLYELSVKACEKPSISAIKALSHAMSIGFVAAKEMLSKGGAVRAGKATDIISLVKAFKDADLTYSISPEFPYDI